MPILAPKILQEYANVHFLFHSTNLQAKGSRDCRFHSPNREPEPLSSRFHVFSIPQYATNNPESWL